MAEKRFTHKKWYNERQLFDGEEPFAIVDVYIQAEEICDKLNKLNDENEQLKQFKDNVFDLIDKNIKETKELFEDGKIDLISYNGAMIILIGLKEELGGDVE